MFIEEMRQVYMYYIYYENTSMQYAEIFVAAKLKIYSTKVLIVFLF